MIRKAVFNDYDKISEIYSRAREFMKSAGNPDQWGDGYPPKERIEKDLAKGALYLLSEEGDVRAVFYFAKERDESYKDIDTALFGNEEYGVIHRVATAVQGKGTVKEIFAYCESICPRLMIDTHKDNIPMQRALGKAGFTACGTVYTELGGERTAFYKGR